MSTRTDILHFNPIIIKMTLLIVSHFSIPILNGQHCVLLVGHHHVLEDRHPMLQSHDTIISIIEMTLLVVSHFSNLELISCSASSSALSSMVYKTPTYVVLPWPQYHGCDHLGRHHVLLVGSHHHVLEDGHPALQSHDMIISIIKVVFTHHVPLFHVLLNLKLPSTQPQARPHPQWATPCFACQWPPPCPQGWTSYASI
ncbi:hypothetical protein EDB83DRAFT_2520403 [Lactarius deliciosus]|nr:hypothetical protein EDB83DRAFT_2520403 [Lactarius deliciosus]